VAVLSLVLALAAAGCGSSARPRRSTPSISAAVRPPAPSAQVKDALLAAIATARSCLKEHRLKVSGGPVYPLQSPTSPDGELIVGSAHGGAVIAFYTNATRAAELEPELARNARAAVGEVERRGSVAVVGIDHPAERLRQTVLTCAFA
jgi:hypothetical protein